MSNIDKNENNRIRRRKVSSNSISNPAFDNENYKVNRKDNNRINKINRSNNSSELKRKKKSKSKAKRHIIFKLAKGFLLLMLVGLIFLSTVGLVFTMISVKDSPKVTKELIESKYVSSMPVSTEQIPQNLKNAVVAIEDERFYKHKGVDVISLTRSVINNIFSDTTQGGSTIDMQVSKNLLTDNEKTIKRKVKDIYNARNMNKVMNKDEILTTYLNNIYLGKSTYGVGKGSKIYFGKDVGELNLAQCAMLAGITNNPVRYMNHDEAKKRQETVLYKMHELKYITDKEYSDALYDPVPFKSEIG